MTSQCNNSSWHKVTYVAVHLALLIQLILIHMKTFMKYIDQKYFPVVARETFLKDPIAIGIGAGGAWAPRFYNFSIRIRAIQNNPVKPMWPLDPDLGAFQHSCPLL